jgi:hypothetical protein
MANLESSIQSSIVNELRMLFARLPYPQPLVHSNHNNASNVVLGMIARTQGRLAGIPDLTIRYSKKNAGGTLVPMVLDIEVKTETGRLSKPQKQVHAILKDHGFLVITCRGVSDALNQVRSILSI